MNLDEKLLDETSIEGIEFMKYGDLTRGQKKGLYRLFCEYCQEIRREDWFVDFEDGLAITAVDVSSGNAVAFVYGSWYVPAIYVSNEKDNKDRDKYRRRGIALELTKRLLNRQYESGSDAVVFERYDPSRLSLLQRLVEEYPARVNLEKIGTRLCCDYKIQFRTKAQE